MGLFQDSTEILNSPTQSFGPVRPGDIRYEDLNGDGVINNNDRRNIGNGSARFQYGLNLRVSFKGFELFALGTGQTGQSRYLNSPYFWVFGDRPYSEVVRDSWTPATASTASYPRLTSTNNGNNFRNSTYWLRSNNGFRLNAVQLTYYLPTSVVSKLNLEKLGIYVLGTNLLDISAQTQLRTLNVGSSPQMRNVAAGLRVYFQ
ncbi:MAG: SusC/RagA family TonB-linked outer membrane protein, partial [Bacteroidia bacterium]|nr:SusC/RagA family TonB-linked outer membrane protein [Bacteroidia bacterium]